MPPALLLAGSGPAGAPLPIVKIANVGKTLNDVAFCGDWLALALSGAVKVRALLGWRAACAGARSCRVPVHDHGAVGKHFCAS